MFVYDKEGKRNENFSKLRLEKNEKEKGGSKIRRKSNGKRKFEL